MTWIKKEDTTQLLPRPQWDTFIRNIISGKTLTEAYKDVDAYKSKRPGLHIKALFKNPNFLKQYSAAIKEVNDQALIRRERVIMEEAAIAFSDISLVFDWDGTTPLAPAQLPPRILPAIKSYKLCKNPVTKKHEYKYEFWDKGKALSRLSKILGLYEIDNQQKNPQGAPGVSIKVNIVGKE